MGKATREGEEDAVKGNEGHARDELEESQAARASLVV